MSLFARLFGPAVELPPASAARLAAWRALADESEQAAPAEATFMVVDVETSGLDARRDRLLAIGACPLRGGRLWAGAGFERIIYQAEATSKENILVHGIAPDEQASGLPAEEALLDFLEFAGKHVLVAYHAPFDRTMIGRAAREVLGVTLPNRWLDLAHLAPALYPEARLPRGSLDDWLGRFDIRVRARHRAVDDVLATGELFLILLRRARSRGIETVGALLAAVEAQQHSVLGGATGGG
jgi:DNA polymerase III subunit epsilon